MTVSRAKVGLSTASVYPESTAAAFELAARLGYDGVEVMVWTDPVSQDPDALLRLSDHYAVPILAVHAPCLLITQRVWGTEPWIKLERARAAAEKLRAPTVVVHPPFRWQRDYARGFRQGIERLAEETDIRFAVENMFPLRVRGREVSAYAPDWDPTDRAAPGVHARPLATPRSARASRWSWPRRWAAGWRTCTSPTAPAWPRTSTWCPAAATSPAASCWSGWRRDGFAGSVVVEVNTRRAADRAEREADLAEALAFTRLHLVAAATPVG